MGRLRNWLGLVASNALITACTCGCYVRRNREGTIDILISVPDLAVTEVSGLEDALEKLTMLLDQCTTGSWKRPVEPCDVARIQQCIANVLELRRCLGPQPAPEAGVGTAL